MARPIRRSDTRQQYLTRSDSAAAARILLRSNDTNEFVASEHEVVAVSHVEVPRVRIMVVMLPTRYVRPDMIAGLASCRRNLPNSPFALSSITEDAPLRPLQPPEQGRAQRSELLSYCLGVIDRTYKALPNHDTGD